MNQVELKHFGDAEELAAAAALDWLKELEGLGPATSRYCVALPGGRMARVFFAAVTARVRARRDLMAPVHFFWGDERCVPPTDPESNFGLARDCLLNPLGIADAQTHRMRVEMGPAAAAAEAEAELRRFASVPSSDTRRARSRQAEQPVLDMIFLGMGEDGHVASLFPGESAEAMASQAVFRAVIGPKPPSKRITLGYAAIAAARQVWVLVSGAGKDTALRESLAPNGRTPLARLLKLRQGTRVWSDR